MILSILFIFMGLFAQSPNFSVSKKSFYIGAVNVGSTKSDSVVVKNGGTDTLKLYSIISTSNEFIVSAVPQSILPGDSATILIIFQPKFWGIKKSNIVFNHNGIGSSDTVFVIGEGMQAILAIYLIDYEFGINFNRYFNNANLQIDSFRVKDVGNVDLKIKAFSTSPYFSVSPESAYAVSVNSLALQLPIFFKVTFKPGTSIERKYGYIVLNHNGSTLSDSIPVYGDVTTGFVGDINGIPKEYSLFQNYPNPFNPSTIISFNMPHTNQVSIKVYNALGQEVSTIVEGLMSVGNHAVQFNANNLPSGIYFYRLIAGEFVQTKTFVLLK